MIFDNDDARRWLVELGAGNVAAVTSALDALDSGPDTPSAAVSATVLAAAALVAARRSYTTGQDAPPDVLVRRTREAVERVFEASELRDQVDAAGHYAAWEDAVGDLLDRLEPPEGRRMI